MRRILLMGYGHVGKTFREFLSRWSSELDAQIVGVVTRRGIMLGDNPDFRKDIEGDIYEALDKLKPDVLVDMSSANYRDGEPSISTYYKCFERGIDVITTNKAPLALNFTEILDKAKKSGRRIGFQGTVMSGTPSINLYRVLPVAKVRKIRGILNGTTNFILTMMYNGVSFDEALMEAKRKGYAEEDPTLDLNGFDTAAKLTILANLMLNKNVKLGQFPFKGIEGVSMQSVEDAKKRGLKMRLIAYADEKEIKVSPMEVSKDDPFFSIDGVYNSLEITNEVQSVTVRGPGAGPETAAYAAISDLFLFKIIK
ncbi:homoserine dehydrogenase [Sulfuracidifex metallicus]|uniref:homoserine dehydrogenase n=1 Tax=Sulfuracidifex metallicus TaxID=47303 RepID=UPI002273FAE8|nr:homoserine dehydrogenase [Sulfuracidifex metallicus]MCY0849885.1 homoserine dehydrogenase [Sulfuracidifex metallicus]